MHSPSPRPYVLLLLAWLLISVAGCIVGSAADGWGSVWPNFLRYGLGGGAGIAALLVVFYLLDRRKIRNASARDR